MSTQDIEKLLAEHEQRITKLESLLDAGAKPNQLSLNKGISIKEFMLSAKPSSDVQKTLCIGYFLERYEGQDSFNLNDIEDGFRKSKESVPGNINDKVNKNIRQGFIMEAKEKKNGKKGWTLTSSGEKEVESNIEKKI